MKCFRDCLKYRFQSLWLVYMCQKKFISFSMYLFLCAFGIVSSAVRYTYCSFGNSPYLSFFFYTSYSLQFITSRFDSWSILCFQKIGLPFHIDFQLSGYVGFVDLVHERRWRRRKRRRQNIDSKYNHKKKTITIFKSICSSYIWPQFQ